MASFFYTALALGFVIPIILVMICQNTAKQSGLLLAAVISLIGLWMAKHSWLIAPQMIPLS
jgi:formate-dependent nitrite reductase membrane component NrfD